MSILDTMGMLRRCVVIGILVSSCHRGAQVCPPGTRVLAQRSKDGAYAWCQSGDGKTLYWMELYGAVDARQVCQYQEGRPEGPFAAYHPGGAKWIVGQYDQGKRDGQWLQWDKSGMMVANGTYRRGTLVAGAPVAIAAKCEAMKP
jgi:hypothetical protein